MQSSLPKFDYNRAFYRNIGWVTETEQQILRGKTVAIAGLGGVGGIHLLTLARMGVQNFHLAEFDTFEVGNFNRQVGATMQSVGKPKLETMVDAAKQINPDCQITVFPDGVNNDNITDFLKDVDVYIDGIDFFAMPARRLVFEKCKEFGVTAITAGPIGMGTAYLIFTPDSMSFEEYFGMDGKSENEQYLRFMIGLTPTAIHRSYLVDATRLNLQEKTGPSTMIACDLCAGVATAEAVKILLKRGKTYPAPYYHIFDAYLNTYKRGYTIGGAKNPLFRLKCFLGMKQVKKMVNSSSTQKTYSRPIEAVLKRAKWSPSAENMQVNRFRILDSYSAEIICSTEPTDVFEKYATNNPSLIAMGILLETAAIAASNLGLSIEHSYSLSEDGKNHIIIIKCEPDATIEVDELSAYIESRSVNRYPYQTRPLTSKEKSYLQSQVGEEFTIEWYETKKEKLHLSKLNAMALDIRLRIKEGFDSYGTRLDWKNKFSPDKVPVATLPLSKISRVIMKFAIKKWSRLNFLNTYMAGTLAPQLEGEIIPGIKCAAHYFIIAKDKKFTKGDALQTIEIGRKLQRFWLAATKLGLAMQPSFAMMFYVDLHRNNVAFVSEESLIEKIRRLAEKFSNVRTDKKLPDSHLVFAGRIGTPISPKITSRSTRKQLEELIIK